jgi:hypothetical protein
MAERLMIAIVITGGIVDGILFIRALGCIVSGHALFFSTPSCW